MENLKIVTETNKIYSSNWDRSKITLRPSSLSDYVSCPRKWYDCHILQKQTLRNVRSTIGTGVHAGCEHIGNSIIKANDKKVFDIKLAKEAAIAKYEYEVIEAKGNILYDDLDDDKAKDSVLQGVDAFVEGILPFISIPVAVEQRYTINLDHPIVEKLSGTVDYISTDTIADIKTSKRAIVADNYVLQQSAYTLLAKSNGFDIKHNRIFGISFGKSKTIGGISSLESNIKQVVFIINNLLDRLKVLYEGGDPDLLFPGNPINYLCSAKYCSSYNTCSFGGGIV